MRLASKGLGRLTLPFALNEAKIKEEEGKLWFFGRIKEKTVNWDYRMRLEDEDIVRFVKLARHPEIMAFIARRCGFSLITHIAKRIWKTTRALLSGKEE